MRKPIRGAPLRWALAMALGAGFVRSMMWVSEQQWHLFDNSWGMLLLILSWFAAVPVAQLAGRAATAVARTEHALAYAAPSEASALPVATAYRTRGCIVLVFISGLLFGANFCTGNGVPFPWPWMVALGLALLVPFLLPPRHVGTVWAEGETLRVQWCDGRAFAIPFRAIHVPEQLLEPLSSPFDKFGSGHWRPLVMSNDDRRRLRELVAHGRKAALRELGASHE